MSAEKLSISLDAKLATDVREAAEAEGRSVSAWLADAAMRRLRNKWLGEALDASAEEFGPISEEREEQLIAESRRRSILPGTQQASA